MKVNGIIFEKLLHKEKITKKHFAEYSNISYNTVVGWKKTNQVPTYAMVILKDIIYRKNLNLQAHSELKKRNKNLNEDNKFNISDNDAKKIEVAFWGTNYTANEILLGIKEHNPMFEIRFKENTMKSFRNKIYKKIKVQACA